MKAIFFRSLALLIIFLVSHASVYGQESPTHFSIGADFVSRYIWRGVDLGGSSPHVQPYVEYAFGESGLTLGAWASESLGGTPVGAEADLYLNYSFMDMFTVGLTDYFFPSDFSFSRDHYFDYHKETTGHTFEAMVSFNGTDDLPLSVLFAINIYGADGINEKGNAAHASYLEVGYSHSYEKTDVTVFAGAALHDPKEEKGAVGWYGNNSAGIINLGATISKSLKISETFSLPVSSSLIFNPEAENIYIVFGLTL